jgi:mercuric ion transport protein
MEKTSLSTVGGIIAAIIASLCCIGPVLVALIGVGSIGAFSVFESYRPYLIGITVLLLGFAFYLVYRKREVKCEDGSCKIQDAGKWNKVGIWSATLLAAVAIAFPYLGVAPLASANVAVQGKAVVSLNVEGMDCKACATGVEGSLASIHGVHKARVSFEKGEAVIDYDPALVKPDAFVKRVKENGFSATIREPWKGL